MHRLRFSISLFVLFVFSSVAYTACIKDACGNMVCSNGGVCVNGVCSCPLLYEGTTCGEPWHQKFADKWAADDVFARDTSGARRKYDFNIIGASDSFIMYGFADTLNGIVCKRSSRFVFTFKADQRQADTFLTIRSGKGTMDAGGTKVTGLYSFTYKDTTITSSFSWTR